MPHPSHKPAGPDTRHAHPHALPPPQLKRWMSDAGMESWVDAVGNVHGRLLPPAPAAAAAAEAAAGGGGSAQPKLVLLGSHYDTVLDGGA